MSAFHVVLISQTGYHRVQSVARLREAADAALKLHHSTVSCGVVVRDGRTGKRHSIRDCIEFCCSDAVLNSYERICRAIAMVRPSPLGFGIPAGGAA